MAVIASQCPDVQVAHRACPAGSLRRSGKHCRRSSCLTTTPVTSRHGMAAIPQSLNLVLVSSSPTSKVRAVLCVLGSVRGWVCVCRVSHICASARTTLVCARARTCCAHTRGPVQAYSIVYMPAHFGQGGGWWVAGKNLSFTTDFKSMIDQAEVIFVSVRARYCAALAHYRPPRAAPSCVCCGAARRLTPADAAEACGHAEPLLGSSRLVSARLGSARLGACDRAWSLG